MSPEFVGRHAVVVDDLQALSIDQLIALYQRAASKHGAATLSDDASSGNANADTVAGVYRELRQRGSETTLLVLLDSSDLGVRAWAAAHAMDFAPEEGEPVLTALADSDEAGLIGFGAGMTLNEWRSGRLRFP